MCEVLYDISSVLAYQYIKKYVEYKICRIFVIKIIKNDMHLRLMKVVINLIEYKCIN